MIIVIITQAKPNFIDLNTIYNFLFYADPAKIFINAI